MLLLENSMFDFNGVYGIKLDENNRWVKKAEIILWDKIEEKYAKNILREPLISRLLQNLFCEKANY